MATDKSAIMEGGKKIHSYEYLKSRENEYCNKAIEKLVPKIDMKYIKNIIEEMPIGEVRKEFYMAILEKRYELLKDI